MSLALIRTLTWYYYYFKVKIVTFFHLHEYEILSVNYLQTCRWTVLNSVGELSPETLSVNCLVSELSQFLWKLRIITVIWCIIMVYDSVFIRDFGNLPMLIHLGKMKTIFVIFGEKYLQLGKIRAFFYWEYLRNLSVKKSKLLYDLVFFLDNTVIHFALGF